MPLSPNIGFNLGGGDLYPILNAGAIQGLTPLLEDFALFCEVLEEEVLPQSMQEALEPTLKLAQHYCPVDTGELVNSGYVEAKGEAGDVTAEIGFGRDGIPTYAIAVHEDPNAHHAPPTQYKFLERAVYEDSMSVMERIAGSVKSKARL